MDFLVYALGSHGEILSISDTAIFPLWNSYSEAERKRPKRPRVGPIRSLFPHHQPEMNGSRNSVPYMVGGLGEEQTKTDLINIRNVQRPALGSAEDGCESWTIRKAER